ncbi:MAG: MarR family transcriptional regulator [Xanthomonadaceae bacterium]|nr:MarR family transcriptional regulator [Xanthomonadaceae bacterium]
MKKHEALCITGLMGHEMGYLLSETASIMRDKLAEGIDSFGIPPRSIQVLTVLEAQDGMTQQSLGQITRLDRASMVLLIDILEKAGLVERTSHPTDRRCHILMITKKGRETQKKIATLTEKIQKEFLKSLTKKQQDDLSAILLKLIQIHNEGTELNG